ncbi:MAG: glutathione S-transferase family protein [Hyphomonadaceae bacterium]
MPHRAAPGILTLYGDSRSGNCLKVKWVAERRGIAFRWIEVDIVTGESRTEAFLTINPSGQVPVAILPDGRPLAQSNAIILYLAEGSDLIPEDRYERGRMFQWLFWEQHSHEPYVAARRWRLSYAGVPEDELDEQLLPKGRRALGVMELALLESEFLVGGAVTLADIALVAYTRVAHEGGFDLSEFPAVRAWVHRVERELGLAPAQEAA